MEKIQLMNIQRQHEKYAGEYEEAALKVMRSGVYIGGEEVAEFEKEFAAYYGVKYGVSCGSGTDALVLALRALGIGMGDEVITVAYTFFATAESIAIVGARPVFVDVCEDTYCMNPEKIEKAITKRTKAILPVHFYGHPADMDAIKSIASKYGLYIVTDCAQAAGAKYNGERKNVVGDVACFSFFPTKNLGCDGDGGMVLTDDEVVADACRALKAHGSGISGLKSIKYQYQIKNKDMPGNMPSGVSKYYNYLIGYNSRLDAIQAAILRRKLLHLEEFIDARRCNANIYDKGLSGTTYGLPGEGEKAYHAYYIYILRHKYADRIIEKLQEKGIACGVYYPIPLHLQGAFLYLDYKQGDMPVAEELCRTTFAIPVYPELKREEQLYIIKTLKETAEEIEKAGTD